MPTSKTTNQQQRKTEVMTTKPNDVMATIELLAETYPRCFSIHQAKRQPLKVGIREDLVTALAGAITVKEAALALAIYTANPLYLKACTQVGAVRVGLDGQAAGHVSLEEAAHAKQRIEAQRAKQQRRQAALAKTKAKAEMKARNAGRISLADLRAMAAARKAAAA